MLDSDTGEPDDKTLEHQGETVREFYSALSGSILVGIEASGSMQWFLELMEAGDRMPRRSSSENPQSRNTQTKT